MRQSVEKARLALENKRLMKKLENTNQALMERVQQLEEFAKDTVKMQGKITELTQYVRSLEQKVNSPGKK